MKKALFAMLLLAAASYVNAQTNEPVTLPMPVEAQRPVVVQQPRFGYLDYRAVFESMPGYAEAQKSLAEIKAKYDKTKKELKKKDVRKITLTDEQSRLLSSLFPDIDSLL